MVADFDVPTPSQDLSGIVGRRVIYTYANGWRYEMYVKNASTIDYRVHSGKVAGRCVKDQKVDLVRLTDDVYKVSWNEPTGTCVVVNLLPSRRVVHGTIFFPRWVQLDGSRIAVYQNEHLDDMLALRDAGPAYPTEVLPNFARITLLEDVGENDDNVISAAPSDLPSGDANVPTDSKHGGPERH
ncbi:phenolic acid decarboxylase [Streptomyces sp. NPDC057101]|uniref:phenolic acid decarboxylase n=1 Tax=Streptomyces sp. NPDC057101 TaxID=3346020 RepID=UPI00362C20E7